MAANNEFLQGFVCAVAILAKAHGERSTALDLLRLGGFELDRDKLEAEGAEPDDLDVLFPG